MVIFTQTVRNSVKPTCTAEQTKSRKEPLPARMRAEHGDVLCLVVLGEPEDLAQLGECTFRSRGTRTCTTARKRQR